EQDDTVFDDLLTNQAYEVLRQGRQPVLVAPPACMTSVTLHCAAADGLVLLPFCRYDQFMSLLLDAEYVFYWNICSYSVLIRVMNRLPVFFFDQGHIARYSTELFSRNLDCYYLGWCPPWLPLTEPLEAAPLAQKAAEQAGPFNAMADNLLKSPAPAHVVRQLLQRPV